jgi:hypothetical protein
MDQVDFNSITLEFNDKQQLFNYNCNTETHTENTHGWVTIDSGLTYNKVIEFYFFLDKGGYLNEKITNKNVKKYYKKFNILKS